MDAIRYAGYAVFAPETANHLPANPPCVSRETIVAPYVPAPEEMSVFIRARLEEKQNSSLSEGRAP